MRKINLFATYILMSLMSLVILNHSEAQAQEWQGYIGPYQKLFVVQNIEIQGLGRIQREAILERIDMKVGSIATNYSVRKDIDRLYTMGFFEQVEIHQAYIAGKKTLLVKLVEKPSIGSIKYAGNDELDEDDFKEKVETKPFAVLDVSQLRKDALALQDLYEEKGYFLAEVEFELKRRKKEQVVDVIFKIKEFDEVKIKQITFVGNKAFSENELKSKLLNKEKGMFSFISGSGSFKKLFFQVDRERLKFFYQTKGYLNVSIPKPIVNVSENRQWIFMKFKVNEGPQFFINEISFAGDSLFEDETLRDKVKSKPNEEFNEELVRADIRRLTELYQDKGYAFANVIRNVKPAGKTDKQNPKLDLELSFQKGEIAYFGNISINGNTKTRDKVIRRELSIHEGMRYSGSKLRSSEANVNRLGFFEPQSVIFKTKPARGAKNILDLEITVKERRTGQVSLGAGFSTSSNFFFQGSIAQNNFLGLGHSLNASVLVSGNQDTYNLGYTNPYFLDTKWLAGADLFRVLSQRIQSFNTQRTGFGLRTGYKLTNNTRFFVNYRLEKIEIERLEDPTINRDQEEGVSSSLQASLTIDKRNNSFEATGGSWLNLISEFGGVGGDHNWFRLEAEGRYYKDLGAKFIFKTRVRMSQLFAVNGEPINRIRRFSQGGPRDMRGFDLEDIGPTFTANGLESGNPTRFNSGGRSLILAQLEIERPLIKDAGLKWVVFTDIGNVFEDYFGKDGQDKLRVNAGIGMRWFSPIGILRFEYGFPLDRKNGEAANQFHFDIGQLF